MDKEENLDTLSEETKRKLAACKTPEEARRVLTEAGEVATLDDGMMAAIAGGISMTSKGKLFLPRSPAGGGYDCL